MRISEALSRFEREQGELLSRNTIHNYRSVVRALEAFGILTTKDLTRKRLAEWVQARRNEDLETSTINVQIASILSIASHLERSALFPLKRLLGLRRLRLRQGAAKPIEYLTREEFGRLRVAAQARGGPVELALLLGVFSGLRMAEILHLHREDLEIDVTEPYVKVLRYRNETKTRRNRNVPIARAFAAELRRMELPPGPLFPPMNRLGRGSYMSHQTLKRQFRCVRDEAGIPKANFFALRRTFGSWLRQAGVEISRLSSYLGNTWAVADKFYATMAPGGDSTVERGFIGDAPFVA